MGRRNNGLTCSSNNFTAIFSAWFILVLNLHAFLGLLAVWGLDLPSLRDDPNSDWRPTQRCLNRSVHVWNHDFGHNCALHARFSHHLWEHRRKWLSYAWLCLGVFHCYPVLLEFVLLLHCWNALHWVQESHFPAKVGGFGRRWGGANWNAQGVHRWTIILIQDEALGSSRLEGTFVHFAAEVLATDANRLISSK